MIHSPSQHCFRPILIVARQLVRSLLKKKRNKKKINTTTLRWIFSGSEAGNLIGTHLRDKSSLVPGRSGPAPHLTFLPPPHLLLSTPTASPRCQYKVCTSEENISQNQEGEKIIRTPGEENTAKVRNLRSHWWREAAVFPTEFVKISFFFSALHLEKINQNQAKNFNETKTNFRIFLANNEVEVMI